MSAADITSDSAAASHGIPAVAPKVSWLTIFGYIAMAFGMFMAILDTQIVAASISEIQAGLSASGSEISWVQTSYLIAEVIMIPLSGYLSRLLSTRVFFAVCTACFTLMSFLCATADTLSEMVVFRALQGFFSGALIPTVFATGFIIFGRNRSAPVSVAMGLIATLAPTIGPTVGGFLTEAFSWHWLFLVNIVPGILVTAAVWNLIDVDKPEWSLLDNVDYAGLVFMTLFLGSTEYVLEEGAKNDWLNDDTILQLAVLAVVSGSIFFWRTLRVKNPIVELHAYKDRNFAIGSTYGIIIGIGLYGITYLLPLYLARVRGLDALQIGELMFVTGMFQFLASPIAGYLAQHSDPRYPIGVGFILLALSCYSFQPITAEWGFWDMFWPQAMRGVGMMFCMIPVNQMALAFLEPRLLKSASGLFNLMRNLGGAFGLAVLNTLLIERVNFHWARLGERVTTTSQNVQDFITGFGSRYESMHPGDGSVPAAKILGSLVMREASVMAFADLFFVLMCLFATALIFLPFARRPHFTMAPARGDH